MNVKTTLLFFAAISFVLLPPAYSLKQEILKVDSLRLRSQTGDLYSSSSDPFYTAYLTLANDYSKSFRNTRVTFLVHDTGYRRSFSRFDLDAGKQRNLRYPLELSSADSIAPGVYYVRVTVSDEHGHRRVKYREIEILP